MPIKLVGPGSDDLFEQMSVRAAQQREMPPDAKVAMLTAAARKKGYGTLSNLGPGAATHITVTFTPTEITRWPRPARGDHASSSISTVDPHEALTSQVMRPGRGQLSHGDTAKLFTLPDVFTLDYSRDIATIRGTIEISCRDIRGKKHTITQDFRAIAAYSQENASGVIMLSFESSHRPEPDGSGSAWTGTARTMAGMPQQ